MREILFRGKRLDNGEWIEGNLLTSPAYPDRVWITESKTFFDRQMCSISFVEIDPSTVGQYTGLTDKNGVKIFEGDIVKVYNIFDEYKGVGTVHWNDLLCGWHSGFPYSMYGKNIMHYDVIGNIHDNPDLLNKEE